MPDSPKASHCQREHWSLQKSCPFSFSSSASIEHGNASLRRDSLLPPRLWIIQMIILCSYPMTTRSWATSTTSLTSTGFLSCRTTLSRDGVRCGSRILQHEENGFCKPCPMRSSIRLWSTSRNENDDEESLSFQAPKQSLYDLGIGKNRPVVNRIPSKVNDEGASAATANNEADELFWNVAEPVEKPQDLTSNLQSEDMWSKDRLEKHDRKRYSVGSETRTTATAAASSSPQQQRWVRKMVAKSQEDARLRGAIWQEDHFVEHDEKDYGGKSSSPSTGEQAPAPAPAVMKNHATTTTESMSIDESPTNDASKRNYQAIGPPKPAAFYPDIDLSIPPEIYNPSEGKDCVWYLMRWEAFQEAQGEPLLVSFLYSSILNHDCLESSLAFLLANKLSSPAMISTQVQSIVLEALKSDPSIGRKLRADIMAVRDRDPACTCLPDVFLYFKGFHALQTYRVANVLWKSGKRVLSHYLQSQSSQTFQIDIHPNATLGSGIMLDHGTGIVVGETAHIGHNCSILHHVTLGGSGKKGVDRHPKVGNGVLLGAGVSILGNVQIGDGCQVGAGTLVITDLPPHSVAVGVPAKIIGSFIDVTEQPSIGMNQMMDSRMVGFQSEGI